MLRETKYLFTIGSQKWRVLQVESDVVLWDVVLDAEAARLVFTPSPGGGWPTRRLVVNEPAWRPQFDLSLRWETPPRPEPGSIWGALTARQEQNWALVDQWNRRWLTCDVTGTRTKVYMTQPFSPWPAPDPEWGLMVAAATCSGYFVSAAVSAAQSVMADGGSDSPLLYA